MRQRGTGPASFMVRTVAIGSAIACLALAAPAAAQPKPAAKAAPETARYFRFDGELMGALTLDGFLKETRVGGKFTGAVLDVCHSVSETSDRKDRFVVTLAPDGAKWTGTTTSQEDGLPVAVTLTRKQAGKTVTFEGTIRRGDRTSQIVSRDNVDMPESEFRESEPQEEIIAETPADFTEVTPDALAVRVARDQAAALVASLRGEKVRISYGGLVQDCAVLRSGRFTFRLYANPERAPALLARLRAMPGVMAAGYVPGTYGMERAILLNAADWSTAGKVDRERLIATLSRVLARNLGAEFRDAAWDDVAGETLLTLRRPSPVVTGLALTDLLRITAQIGPDRPGPTDRLVLRLSAVGIDTIDEGAEPHLLLADASSGGLDDESDSSDSDGMLASIARELKGRVWDIEQGKWK